VSGILEKADRRDQAVGCLERLYKWNDVMGVEMKAIE